jgi:hypothetical protein
MQQEKQEFADLLEEMIQRSDLISALSSSISTTGNTSQPKKRYRIVHLLTQLMDCPQLSPEQQFEVAKCLCDLGPVTSPERHAAFQLLIGSAQRPDTPPKQALQMLLNLYQDSVTDGEEQQVSQVLTGLVQRPDLQVEDALAEIETTFRNFKRRSIIEQLILGMLDSLAQRPDLQVETLIDSALRIAQSKLNRLHERSSSILELERFYHTGVPNKEILQFMRHLYLDSDTLLEHRLLKSYAQRADLPRVQAFQVAQCYHDSHQGEDKKELVATLLIFYSLRHDATSEQAFQTLQMLWQDRISRNMELLLTLLLLQITQRSDMPIEYAIKIAQIISNRQTTRIMRRPLYQIRQAALTQWLRSYAEGTDLSCEQALPLADALLQFSRVKWANNKAWQLLLRIAQDKKLSREQRRRALIELLQYINSWSWSRTAQIIRLVSTLQTQQEARTLLNTHWTGTYPATVNDTPVLVELVRQELVPPRVRDQIYKALQSLIPRFHELDDIPTIQQESSLNGKERG